MISLAHVILSFLMPFLVFFTAIYKKKDGFWKNIWKFPNPMITKYRKFMLEYQEHKLRSFPDEEERKKRILKVKKKQEKHTRFLNVSLINEAAMESSFQLWFQTLYMFPIVLFFLGGESGCLRTEVIIGTISILCSFISLTYSVNSVVYIRYVATCFHNNFISYFLFLDLMFVHFHTNVFNYVGTPIRKELFILPTIWFVDCEHCLMSWQGS